MVREMVVYNFARKDYSPVISYFAMRFFQILPLRTLVRLAHGTRVRIFIFSLCAEFYIV